MERTIPWIEKYRPNCIEDIIIDNNTEKQIDIFLKDQSNVHLIIMGSPGVGKT